MSNTYTWKITAINSVVQGDLVGVVSLAQWELWAENLQGQRAMVLGTSNIAPVADPSQFIPRDLLQESDVLSWVAQSFTEEELATTLSEVDRRLVDPTATLSVRLPWAPLQVQLSDEQAQALQRAQEIINVDNNP